MPKIRLTAAAINHFQPPLAGQVEYYDAHLPAFGLRISYSGAKAWFVMTRVDRKLTRVTLGRYPTLSLAEARHKARLVVEHARAGADPRYIEAEERRRKEHERQNTFESIASLFLTQYAERELRTNTVREYRRILKGHDTKNWQSRPIRSLNRSDIVELLTRIEHRGAPAAGNRSLAYLSKFFNWCLEQELLPTSPTARVRPLSAAPSRDRVLDEVELTWIGTALEGFPPPFGPLFRVLALTGQRRGEVAGMRWDELRGLGTNQALWDLTGDRTKNGQPHLVPLAPAVQTIIATLPRTSSLVFSTNGTTPVSGFSKAKRQLDGQITRLCSAQGAPPLPSWTLHDLRRTMVTVMNEHLGIQPHVVEAIVNHTSGIAKRGVAGVYNRALYLEDRRTALTRWQEHLFGLFSVQNIQVANRLSELQNST